MKTLTDLWARGNVTIQNTDAYPGTFTVEFSFRTLNRNYVDQATTFLNPGESKMVSGEYNTSLGENWDWDYHVVPATVRVPETITQNKKVPLLRW
jgi:hypothetical protein